VPSSSATPSSSPPGAISGLSINELVAIAVLAAFASGDYKTAGVVAFFMLLGEIIETRTAEGARASIESLINSPPPRRAASANGEEEVAASDLAGRRCHPHPSRRQRGRRRRDRERPGLVQPGHHHRRIAPGGQKPGDEVFAGTQNLTGVLEIKVSRAGRTPPWAACAN
jgi:Zn2+/Cd2+-exporting ATPase